MFWSDSIKIFQETQNTRNEIIYIEVVLFFLQFSNFYSLEVGGGGGFMG